MRNALRVQAESSPGAACPWPKQEGPRAALRAVEKPAPRRPEAAPPEALAAATPGLRSAPAIREPPVPDARAFQALALRAFEALQGVRSIAQLGPWITPEVAEGMRSRRSLIIERRTLTKDTRRLVARPGPVHICAPSGGAIEAAVILHAQHRAIAVAMRFEVVSGRWRATALTVL